MRPIRFRSVVPIVPNVLLAGSLVSPELVDGLDGWHFQSRYVGQDNFQ